MDKNVKSSKRRFDAQLRHVKVILLNLKKTLPEDQWLTVFHETKKCILNHPADFLGDGLPDMQVTEQAIDKVFDGFLSDMHIRNVQAFRTINETE